MPIPHLSAEIWQIILEQVEAHIEAEQSNMQQERSHLYVRTLYNFCLTNKTLCFMAQPLLYKSWTDKYSTDSPLKHYHKFLRTLIERPDLASCVRKAVVKASWAPEFGSFLISDYLEYTADPTLSQMVKDDVKRFVTEGDKSRGWLERCGLGHIDALIVLILHHLPNLETLDIRSQLFGCVVEILWYPDPEYLGGNENVVLQKLRKVVIAHNHDNETNVNKLGQFYFVALPVLACSLPNVCEVEVIGYLNIWAMPQHLDFPPDIFTLFVTSVKEIRLLNSYIDPGDIGLLLDFYRGLEVFEVSWSSRFDEDFNFVGPVLKDYLHHSQSTLQQLKFDVGQMLYQDIDGAVREPEDFAEFEPIGDLSGFTKLMHLTIDGLLLFGDYESFTENLSQFGWIHVTSQLPRTLTYLKIMGQLSAYDVDGLKAACAENLPGLKSILAES